MAQDVLPAHSRFAVRRRAGLSLLAAAGVCGCWSLAVMAQAAPEHATVLVYDASGSMWGPLPGGATKVEVAREVIGEFFASRDQAMPLGVVAYGHNRRGDCADIELIAPVAVHDAGKLSARLNRINPVGMTPLTDALQRAAEQIPATAESADIILVTDGLETCDADPCALAARLAESGIAIRAHVVGFGLSEAEAAAMACVAQATGGQMLTPQSGQELADALNRIAQVSPEPPPIDAAFFDIGPQAEAGHTYRIGYQGTVPPDYYVGFSPRSGGRPVAGASFGVVGGAGEAGSNPVSRVAPSEPGDYDLVMIARDNTVIARQAIGVVPPANGFDAIGSVEPGKRFTFSWRGPDQVGQRIVIARPDDPPRTYHGDWGYALHRGGTMDLRAPGEPGIYALRYMSSNQQQILFSREFGVGVPFEDAGGVGTVELAAAAAVATASGSGSGELSLVRATFRIPEGFPPSPLSWSARPLDAGMSPEAWAPIDAMIRGEGEFEPGRYEVTAMAPGEVMFRSVVELLPGEKNTFEISLVDDPGTIEESDGFSEPAVLVCRNRVEGCPFHDVENGLTLHVPDGWSLTQPLRYRTAGGIEADVASANLFREDPGGVQVLALNPRQWTAVMGECIDIGVHRLCHGESDSVALRRAIALITRSLAVTEE